MIAPRSRLPLHRLAVVAFILYAIALFTLTHWPALGPPPIHIPRPDLLVHFGAFGLWAVLLFASGLAHVRSPASSAMPSQAFIRVWIAGTLYAAFDEALQLIPQLKRTAAWDDLAANIGGITLGLLAVFLILRSSHGPTPQKSGS